MRIMVLNVAAESSGALSVLNDFYHEIITAPKGSDTWYFVVSKPTHFAETDRVKVLRFPWVKKSWLHRLVFDYLVAPRLVRRHGIGKVLSLQNVIIPFVKVSRIVYVHNALPFAKYRYKFKENRLLWVYQNVIKRNIISSIKRADKVIAQTNWMKRAFVEQAKVPADKIVVCPPLIHIPEVAGYQKESQAENTFFYPATGLDFKNHRVIIEACKQLVDRNVTNYTVILTLASDENEPVADLHQEVEANHLPIRFVGKLKREEVFHQYGSAVLLFPSYIESYPLPLIEARKQKSPIVASDMPFSHEILAGYENVRFFDPFAPSELAALLAAHIDGRIDYIEPREIADESKNVKSLIEVVTK